MLSFKLIYHSRYDLNLGAHVFPSQKFRLIRELLLQENLAAPEDFLEPKPASDEDVLRVHTPEYARKLKTGTLSATQMMALEIPWSREMVEACWLAAGGSILAAQCALRDGFAANIGGGFHHAFPGHGEGFCAIHDVAIAIRRLQADKAIRTAVVVDVDVHQGNGTAAIFRGDDSVFTLSIHQENNYPMPKPPSDMDINLPDGIGDADYLAILQKHLDAALQQFTPDLLFYIGGADPYCEDQLGGLHLTKEGLRKRDDLVFERARNRNIPVAIALAGGYARRVEDTVRIHVGTILAAREATERSSADASANHSSHDTSRATR
ncbi:MAG TPA: histone deacetylase [Candidatus Dormibacteraeota bacterium]|nr:histone deacetylase [Candidatus Dormibacteraeota bacterium]